MKMKKMKLDKVSGDIWYEVPFDEVVVKRPKQSIGYCDKPYRQTPEQIAEMCEDACKKEIEKKLAQEAKWNKKIKEKENEKR